VIRYFPLLVCLLSPLAGAAELPYDESAEATSLIQKALISAKASGVPVLVILGANWCGDCRALDEALKSKQNAERIATEFRVVKIDVGNFDRNQLLALSYGNPIQNGIPAAVVLSPDNQVLYTTRAGELAGARLISEKGIYDFLKRVSQIALPRH
jgi:protein disulfide-isomerase